MPIIDYNHWIIINYLILIINLKYNKLKYLFVFLGIYYNIIILHNLLLLIIIIIIIIIM